MGKTKKARKVSGLIPDAQTQRGMIPQPAIPPSEELQFSFKYLDLDGNPKFAIAGYSEKYYLALLERMRELCKYRCVELRVKPDRSNRFHLLTWADTSEPKGFAHLPKHLQDSPGYQFSISSNKYGRVHGFLIDNCFFIVWLDPDHKLYLAQR